METWVLAALWDRNPEAEEGTVAALLPPERLVRLRAGDLAKRTQILASYALLRYGAQRFWNLAPLPVLDCGPHGKPAFRDVPSCHFSLSHTAGLALCAFSDAPVGVDGERLRPVDPARAERLRLGADSAAFFREWTARESRVKLRGGSVLECRAPVLSRPGEHDHTLEIAPGYAAAVCTLSDAPVRVECLKLEELLRRCCVNL